MCVRVCVRVCVRMCVCVSTFADICLKRELGFRACIFYIVQARVATSVCLGVYKCECLCVCVCVHLRALAETVDVDLEHAHSTSFCVCENVDLGHLCVCDLAGIC